MKSYLRDYVNLMIIAGIVIGLDQWTKSLVRSLLSFSEMWSPWDWLAPYARIVHWKNSGAAFGMLQGFGDIFMILAILVAGAIVFYFPRVPREDWPLRLAMGLQLGGALGNLTDRLTQGYVIDFISVGNFPVFNVADSSISVGAAILILSIWIKDRSEKASQISPDPGLLSATQESSSASIPEELRGE